MNAAIRILQAEKERLGRLSAPTEQDLRDKAEIEAAIPRLGSINHMVTPAPEGLPVPTPTAPEE